MRRADEEEGISDKGRIMYKDTKAASTCYLRKTPSPLVTVTAEKAIRGTTGEEDKGQASPKESCPDGH